jgi:hypothetical protein
MQHQLRRYMPGGYAQLGTTARLAGPPGAHSLVCDDAAVDSAEREGDRGRGIGARLAPLA